MPGITQSMLVPERVREFFRCRVLRPLLRLLRGGVTPRRLAWSLALGMAIGINPSVGLTTLVVIALAWVFGLNQVASLDHGLSPRLQGCADSRAAPGKPKSTMPFSL